MSGGVDSSVTAAILREQGYEVIGVTMQLFQEAQNIADAKVTADALGIPHYVFDFRPVFEEQIIGYFCNEYLAGRTPNPCVRCNPQIKFGLLFDKARDVGATLFATGHYVNVVQYPTTGRYTLKAASAKAKDQSYFLYRLSQEQLARTLFPLAIWTKEQIREKARTLGLTHVAAKTESQENCFIGEQSYQQYLANSLPSESRQSGPIVDTHGNVLGEHQGIHLYTIGQRRGLGIALGSPRYVVAIHSDTNTVVVGENADLFTQEFTVRDLNFLAVERLDTPLECHVKIRYRNAATSARVFPGPEPGEMTVHFETPQRAVTPGQSAVFYEDDLILGGGIIM
jgi:tRNA-specific 2-thiouridylase